MAEYKAASVIIIHFLSVMSHENVKDHFTSTQLAEETTSYNQRENLFFSPVRSFQQNKALLFQQKRLYILTSHASKQRKFYLSYLLSLKTSFTCFNRFKNHSSMWAHKLRQQTNILKRSQGEMFKSDKDSSLFL